MEESSNNYERLNSDSNYWHPIYRVQALASSNLNSSKLREPPGISNLPNYYNERLVKEMSMESCFTGFPLKDAYRESRKLGNDADQRYFMVCNFCLWCASCISAHYSFAANKNNNTCPSCNEGTIEWLPIAKDENYGYNLSSTGGIELGCSNHRSEESRT